jgi:predicted RNase H-like HicB family nuclease
VSVTYDLFLESGPRRRKTMVHVPALLGCVANGPTTEAALEATPEAIETFRRFLARLGEEIDPDEPFTVRLNGHVTEGGMLGDGSPYIHFPTDLVPITGAELDLYLRRLGGMSDVLAAWVANQTNEQLDATPASGRTAREIVLHVIGAQGPTLSYALSSAPGFGAIHGAAKRGDIPLTLALEQVMDHLDVSMRATTLEQRQYVRELNGNLYTLRKATRHLLEHTWNHLRELSRRPGGPEL